MQKMLFNECIKQPISMAKVNDLSKTLATRKNLIEDCAKDGGEEFFTEMHRVRITNLYRFCRNSIKERTASR